MPLADTPQKRDGRPSPEQMNSMSGDVPEALLFHLVCAQETERENFLRQRELLVFVVIAKKTTGPGDGVRNISHTRMGRPADSGRLGGSRYDEC